jgi:hypothetical protein
VIRCQPSNTENPGKTALFTVKYFIKNTISQDPQAPDERTTYKISLSGGVICTLGDRDIHPRHDKTLSNGELIAQDCAMDTRIFE